jgi:lysyl endopeptidase
MQTIVDNVNHASFGEKTMMLHAASRNPLPIGNTKDVNRRKSFFSAATFVLLGIAALISTAGTSQAASTASPPIRVEGEPAKPNLSQKKSQLETNFRAEIEAAAPTITFFAIDPSRIEEAKRGNLNKNRKAMQIGVTQYIGDEAFTDGKPELTWKAISNIGFATQINVRSPGALSTRVAVSIKNLPASAELRFAGSAVPSNVVYVANGLEVYTLIDDQKRYWTPATDGDAQIIEIFVPSVAVNGGANLNKLVVEINAISHIFATINDGFKAATQLKGASGACNVDAICPAQTPGYVNAKNAVAHMQFQANCGTGGALATCICTGTLLNDTDTSTQIPYFFSANHCLSTQTQANSLTTFWNYDNPVCGGADILRSQSNAVSGGAQLLYNDLNSDVLLLRLNNGPPSTAFFSGWDSSTIAGGVPITILHHPAGDPKKVTLGQTIPGAFTTLSSMGNASFVTPTYTSGVTEGGSSGSGIFTINNGNYFLRGGLLGGPSSCATANDINNPSNRDYFSRFDLAFPNISRFLASSGTSGPLNYSDMWWVGTSENGWGMSIQQHSPSNIQFNALYIYDDNGRPLWVVMPGGTWTNNFTTFSGPVFIPTGSPFSNYNAAAFVANPSVGTVTLNFSGINNATMIYTINGRSGTKAITRQIFGSGTAPLNVNDLWWGGTTQNGWGINLAQQQGKIFGVWYTYGADSRATWYVLPDGAWSGNTYSGTLFRTLGSAWLGTTYNPALLQVINVGIMTLSFSNADNAAMTYTVDGVTQIKSIIRQPF